MLSKQQSEELSFNWFEFKMGIESKGAVLERSCIKTNRF